MSYTQTIDLPCHRLGDSYLGLGGFGAVTIVPAGETEAAQPPEPLTRVRMQFRKHREVFTLDTEPGESVDFLMTITDPARWIVEIGIIENFLPSAGAWKWDAEFTSDYFSGGVTLYGGVLNVTEDTTKP